MWTIGKLVINNQIEMRCFEKKKSYLFLKILPEVLSDYKNNFVLFLSLYLPASISPFLLLSSSLPLSFSSSLHIFAIFFLVLLSFYHL